MGLSLKQRPLRPVLALLQSRQGLQVLSSPMRNESDEGPTGGTPTHLLPGDPRPRMKPCGGSIFPSCGPSCPPCADVPHLGGLWGALGW